MSYADWINLFNTLRNTNIDNEKLQYLLSLEPNNNYNESIIEEYKELLYDRLQLSIDKIIQELDIIFNDYNYMDFKLVGFKKEITYLIKMLDIKILNEEQKKETKENIQENVNKIFDIMEKKSLEFDYTGVLETMIRSNRIKWS